MGYRSTTAQGFDTSATAWADAGPATRCRLLCSEDSVPASSPVSDDHLGYPGAYGEGLAGIWARELSRAAILDALWNRRTIAVSGDRIRLFATLNDRLMGSEIPFTREREFEISVQGKDEIEKIEILKNNRVVYRYFPEDYVRQRWTMARPGSLEDRIRLGALG